MAYEQVPITQWGAANAGVIPNDVYGVAINWFVNRTPLLTRLPRLPVGSPTFLVTNDNYRPRSQAVTVANGDTTTGTLTVADTSMYMVGDVVRVETEDVLVTAITSGVALAVTRGYGGSTPATHVSTTVSAYIIGNTRTGAEVDVASLSRVPAGVEQYTQTSQFPYAVGGAIQADTNYVSAYNSPLDRDRMMALQHCVDDFESSAYDGRGVKLAAVGTRPQMKGLQTLITTNNTTSPTNAAAYKPSDLIRDSVQACFNGGGNPSLLVVSTDFLTGFAVWGHAVMRVNAGATVFGVSFDMFEVPFLSGMSIVPAPLLRAGTCICLSLPEVRVRLKRPLFDKPRGSRGDAIEGDIIQEGAVELDNEAHHSWLSGITSFAAA